MKKTIIALALMLVSGMTAMAQSSVDDIFNEYKNAKKAEYVHIPKLLLKAARMMNSDDSDASKVLSKINSVTVLSFDECKKSIRKDLTEKVNNLGSNGYEELMRVKDDGEKVTIYTKGDGDNIKELVIFTGGDDDTALIKITGNILKEDIDELVKENTK